MAGILEALKIEVSAVTASFRYPHVMIGKLPTFEMPPPATIYGHLCGVIGEWFEPGNLEFAYTFTHAGIGEDMELGHIVEYGTSRDRSLGELPVNIRGSMNPQRRQFLFKPHMTLYLRGERQLLQRLEKAFFSPCFSYILGRSQDLATVHQVEWIRLEEYNRAFFSHTLLPWSLRQWILPGKPVHMPKCINYYKLREPIFEQYLELGDRPLRIFGQGVEEDIINRQPFTNILIDSSEARTFMGHELARGLWFHRLEGMGKID